MTPRERVWATLRGEPVDRPPVSFWGHFYHRESSASELVAATLEHQPAQQADGRVAHHPIRAIPGPDLAGMAEESHDMNEGNARGGEPRPNVL